MAYNFPDLFISKITGGYAIKQSVIAASTGDVNLATNLIGVDLDGQILSVGQRILLKNQTTGTQNGVYVVGSGAGATVRADDMATGQNVAGVLVPVEFGVIATEQLFVCVGASSVVGTNALTFTAVLGPNFYGNLRTAATQTLTNKTMTAVTNNITADQLLTTGSPVVFATATAPSAGQLLTATSPTAANWQTPVTGGETNTASNVNTLGVGVFANKTGVDLRFRTVSTTVANGIAVTTSAIDNWIIVTLDLASVNRAAIGGILSPAKGGTGFSTIPGSGSRFILTNGASAFTTKPDPGGTIVQLTSTTALTNKTINDASNFVNFIGVSCNGSLVGINSATAAATTAGAVLRATTTTTATLGPFNFPFTTLAYGVSEAASASTSTTTATKLEVTFSSVSGRVYHVRWYSEGIVATPVTSTAVLNFSLVHNTGNTVICTHTNPSYSGTWPFGGQVFFTAAATSATYPVRIIWASHTTGQTVTIQRSRILVFNYD